jgi:hypothetical protein
LDLYTIGRTPWTGNQPVARPLPKYRTTQTQNKREHTRTHTHTPNIHALSGIRTHDHSVRASEDSSWLRPLGYRDWLASERAKTVRGLDRSATVTGQLYYKRIYISHRLKLQPNGIHDKFKICVFIKVAVHSSVLR